MALGDNLTPEQLQVMNLLVFLIEQFEDQHYQALLSQTVIDIILMLFSVQSYELRPL